VTQVRPEANITRWWRSSLCAGDNCVAWAFDERDHVWLGHSRHLDTPVILLSGDHWRRFTESVADAPTDSGHLPGTGPDPLLTWAVDGSGTAVISAAGTTLPTFTPSEWRAFVQAIRLGETHHDAPRSAGIPTPA
jgi:hypothetical protein